MKTRNVFAAALLGGLGLSAATSALAEPPQGPYVAVDAGYHFPRDIPTGSFNSPDASLHNGWMVDERLGYRVNPSWRVEIEGAYRSSRIENLGANGYFRTYSAMANLIWDLLPTSKVHPFIGGGAGANFPRLQEQFGAGTALGSRDPKFAWQALGGFTFAASERVNLDLTYRYFDGGKANVNCSGACPATPIQFGHYRDHSLTVGLRYALGSMPAPPPPPPPPAPPPPPPPAPPPPPPPMAEAPPAFVAKEFIIYFPFDQSVITPEAMTVIHDAAQYAVSGHSGRIVVVGHTDSSGSAGYNQALSERRAKAAADALVSQGVPAAGLSVEWKGESDLAVQTPDGVKEPLNRRSTVNINF